MTINKSQGQSLIVSGLNLENSCFSHGQLHVTCSRVGKPSALFVLAPNNKIKQKMYIRRCLTQENKPECLYIYKTKIIFLKSHCITYFCGFIDSFLLYYYNKSNTIKICTSDLEL